MARRGCAKWVVFVAGWLSAGLALAEASCATGMERVSAAARLAVSVDVPLHLSLRVVQLPGAVTVTPHDIARGYVDAAAPVDLVVHSNHREGFRVLLSTTSDAIQRVVLSGDGQVIEAAGSTVVQRAAGQLGLQGSRLAWRARFYLSSSAVAGEIARPINVGLAP